MKVTGRTSKIITLTDFIFYIYQNWLIYMVNLVTAVLEISKTVNHVTFLKVDQPSLQYWNPGTHSNDELFYLDTNAEQAKWWVIIKISQTIIYFNAEHGPELDFTFSFSFTSCISFGDENYPKNWKIVNKYNLSLFFSFLIWYCSLHWM